MDFGHYTDKQVQAAADLVNTLAHPSGTELLPDPDAAARFLMRHHFSDVGRVSDQDLAQLRDLRARLEAIFYARDQGQAMSLVNDLLAELEIRPHLTDHDGSWHFHYVSEDAPLERRVASALVMGLATVITEHGFERLGVCAAEDCGDVFVDASRNRSRRYCEEACATRTNVAAYRARAKAASQSRGSAL